MHKIRLKTTQLLCGLIRNANIHNINTKDIKTAMATTVAALKREAKIKDIKKIKSRQRERRYNNLSIIDMCQYEMQHFSAEIHQMTWKMKIACWSQQQQNQQQVVIINVEITSYDLQQFSLGASFHIISSLRAFAKMSFFFCMPGAVALRYNNALPFPCAWGRPKITFLLFYIPICHLVFTKNYLKCCTASGSQSCPANGS